VADDASLADTTALLAALPRRISDLPALGAARAPNDRALLQSDRAWSYAELARETSKAAALLAAKGVRPGDRVLVVGENCSALVVLLLAIARIDAWAVPVNARLSAREIDAIREHCSPRRCVYLTLVSVDARQHALRHGAVEMADVCGVANVVFGAVALACVPEPVADDPARQVAALLYTTGTTGDPKGVLLTHRNLLFIARVSGTLRGLRRSDCVYGVLPISHVYGLASVCLGTLFAGASLLLEPRYSPAAMAHALERSELTVVQGVPAMFAKLLEHLRAAESPIIAPRVRLLYAGGSPLDAGLKSAVERRFGLTLHNGYGLTEASPTIAQTRLDAPRDDCAVGPALPGVGVRLVDGDGRDVATGSVGELWARGPNVMHGYYRDAGLTARTIDADGWLNTGDLARQAADGALFIVGRSKDLIIRSGFNVYPAEVEGVLNSHPDVVQSAVVGRAVAGNEEVVAFVELAPGSVASAEDVAGFAAQRLAPYKRPAQVVMLPALPVSSTGKVLKHVLRMQANRGGGIETAAKINDE